MKKLLEMLKEEKKSLFNAICEVGNDEYYEGYGDCLRKVIDQVEILLNPDCDDCKKHPAEFTDGIFNCCFSCTDQRNILQEAWNKEPIYWKSL